MYSLYFTDNQGCSNTDSVYLNIHSLPNIDLGNDTSFCENTLALDAGSYPTTSWNTGSYSQTITVNTTGTYTVSVTDVNSCVSSDTINVEVFANPELNLGNDTYFCGDSLLLSIATNNTLVWSTGDTLSYTTINSSGDYWINITDSNGCSASYTINLTLLSNTNTPILTKSGDSIISNLSGAHYWFIDESLISNENGSSIKLDSAGSYTAISIDSNGCLSDTSNSVNYLASQRDFKLGNLKIYPNPNGGTFTVEIPNELNANNLQISLVNAVGKEVNLNVEQNGNNLQLSTQAVAGVYFLFLSSEKGSYYQKVVVR